MATDAHEEALEAAIKMCGYPVVRCIVDAYLADRPDLKRVPQGFVRIQTELLVDLRKALSELPVDSMGLGSSDEGRYWYIRDEFLEAIDGALAAAPEPEDG